MKELHDLHKFLGITIQQLPDDDQDFFNKRRAPGTCEWITSQSDFVDWFQDDTATPSILWLTAGPASGKSTMASFIVNWLVEQGAACQYYFFRFTDQSKRSLGLMLRALVIQICRDIPQFRKQLKSLSDISSKLENADARILWQKLFVSALFTNPRPKPIFWVIDGLDECESSHTLLDLLSSLPRSLVSIRIIATSRFTPALSTKIDQLSLTVPVKKVSLDGNSTDFAVYASRELDPIPWPADLRQEVVSQVLERAQGSFLWVHFALQEIVKCHTPDAIQEVLNDIPTGMESLYRSIETDMLRNIRQADISLAKTILRWATCSRSPLTLKQLQEALLPEFSSLLDLRYTVSSLCGQFIVIDRQDRVTMLHETARDYLLRSSRSELSLNVIDSQAYQLHRCLFTLMQPRGLGALGTESGIDFRSYALTSWPYHLKESSAGSNEVLDVVVQFLSGQSVFDWIHTLASSKQIKIMVHASKTITHFVQKRRRIESSLMPLLHRLKDLDWLETWATDLIRIVGKFGSALLQEPTSIFKLIPAFCPRESAIHRLAGVDLSPLSLSVNGVSDTGWDDRLAKLSISHDARALMMRSTTRFFAIATSERAVTLWDTQSLEMTRTLRHNENITAISFSGKGDQFATYGFLTTILWDALTGQPLFKVDNPSGTRALTMAFCQLDTALIIGCNDRKIRRLSLSEPGKGWQTLELYDSGDEHAVYGSHQNSPCCLDFNNDASMVAIGYRGAPLSVWQLEPARLINQCLKDGGLNSKTSKGWASVDRVQWHPTAGEVLGIYHDGSIFKWHPFRNEHHQIHTVASEFHCSPEGTMFVTSDSHGNIKLYDYSSFSLVYQLSCDNPITALCMSPDCQRIYDLRGSNCNIWEPNVLVRLSASDPSSGDTNSEYDSSIVTKGVSEAWVEQVSMITALAPTPNSTTIIVGNEDGLVSLFDPDSKTSAELWRSVSFMTVENIACCSTGGYVASSDLSGKLMIHELNVDVTTISQGRIPTPRKVLDKGLGESIGSIDQLLFDPTGSALLAHGRNGIWKWSANTASESLFQQQQETPTGYKYINHPLKDIQLLAFDLSGVTVYEWSSFSPVARHKYEDISITLTASHENSKDVEKAEDATEELLKIIVSHDKRYIVVAFQRSAERVPQAQDSSWHRLRRTYIRVIQTSSFETRDPGNSSLEEATLAQIAIPDHVAARMEMPLAVLSRGRLVFLDDKYWVCTWHMSDSLQSEAVVRKHYFLPRDWIGAEELRLCTLSPEGSLLYPRNGQVAVVRSNIAIVG